MLRGGECLSLSQVGQDRFLETGIANIPARIDQMPICLDQNRRLAFRMRGKHNIVQRGKAGSINPRTNEVAVRLREVVDVAGVLHLTLVENDEIVADSLELAD